MSDTEYLTMAIEMRGLFMAGAVGAMLVRIVSTRCVVQAYMLSHVQCRMVLLFFCCHCGVGRMLFVMPAAPQADGGIRAKLVGSQMPYHLHTTA